MVVRFENNKCTYRTPHRALYGNRNIPKYVVKRPENYQRTCEDELSYFVGYRNEATKLLK